MATLANFSIIYGTDGTITVGPLGTSINGWSLEFRAMAHFGATSGVIIKTAASGYGGGQSGITVANSGNGTFNVQLNNVGRSGGDASGVGYSNLAYSVRRLDSGFLTEISEGLLTILPG